MLTQGDKNVVANLRQQYGDKLSGFTDEQVAKAWREYSLSDEYIDRHTKPELFIEWAQMAKDGQL